MRSKSGLSVDGHSTCENGRIENVRCDGFVYLVGAGPGNPDLITVAGRRALESADSILYDALVDRRLLELAPTTAERIYVGKEGCRHHFATPQPKINELLIEQAKLGRRVVRLKGGDPLLFARGAEESLALEAAGIDYAIIPGVTAALASAATASIPLTHRGIASAVAFVTGHEDPSKADNLEWDSLSKFPGTLVVYMALTRIAAISDRLIRSGKDGQTPLALVEWGGTNRQQIHESTLEAMRCGPPPHLASPVLAIIGETCRLRETLGWFERRPLFGQRIVVTRPPGQAPELVERLEALGAQTIAQPVFDILPPADWQSVDVAIERLSEFQWLVFTSRNGVTHFFDRILAVGKDLRALRNVQLAAIGPGTAETLREYHLTADLVPQTYRAESLAEALIARNGNSCVNVRVLLVRANRGREVLGDELSNAGMTVETAVAYQQVDRPTPEPRLLDDLRAGRIDWILFSSSNMARGFFGWLDDELGEQVRKTARIGTISPVTSEAIRDAGYSVAAEAERYTIDGLVAAVVAACQKVATG